MIVADKLSVAILGYLRSNNTCSLIKGSLIAPGGAGGPVVGAEMGDIVYP